MKPAAGHHSPQPLSPIQWPHPGNPETLRRPPENLSESSWNLPRPIPEIQQISCKGAVSLLLGNFVLWRCFTKQIITIAIRNVTIANSWDEKYKYHWDSFVFFTWLRTFTIHDLCLYLYKNIYKYIIWSWITESRNDEDISCSKNDLSVS